jgi:hypothetical protein
MSEYLVGDKDTSIVSVVLVAFNVYGTPEQAQGLVQARLDNAMLLMINDSTDFERGTADPLITYAVLPINQLLEESL